MRLCDYAVANYEQCERLAVCVDIASGHGSLAHLELGGTADDLSEVGLAAFKIRPYPPGRHQQLRRKTIGFGFHSSGVVGCADVTRVQIGGLAAKVMSVAWTMARNQDVPQFMAD